MVIERPQAGHWILVRASEASASSSCLQLGQTKVTSIRTPGLELNLPENRASPARIPAKSSLIRPFELFDSREDRGVGGGALLDRCEKRAGLLRVAGADQHEVVQFNGGEPRVAHVGAIQLEPVFQACGALLLRRLERGFEIGRQSWQRRWRGGNRRWRRRAAAIFGLFPGLDLLPVAVKLLAAPESADDQQDGEELFHDSWTRSMRAPSCFSLSSIFS